MTLTWLCVPFDLYADSGLFAGFAADILEFAVNKVCREPDDGCSTDYGVDCSLLIDFNQLYPPASSERPLDAVYIADSSSRA